MQNGANSVHKLLRTELEDYIKSQYFGKSPLLLSALSNHIDDEGLLYQKPFIESSPAYVTVPNGINTASIEPWMKEYFLQLAQAGIGVFPSPFAHQISALEAATKGENLFVSTGTGSGKTECFMWPLLAKMATEARNSKESWAKRGIRTIIMYPMNALVSDQVSRLRRMIGDPDKKFIKIFRSTYGDSVRRPQFGMYTGRTPYPGAQPSTEQDRKLEKTLARMSFPQSDSEKEFFNQLLKEGKRYYPGQYLFEKQYCNVILRVSWMGLFGWDGDKPFQCLRIGRQFHLQALQKYTVSCWRALDTSIYNLTACYGLFFLSAQWKRVHPPSRPKVMHKPSFRRHYKSIVSSNRFQLLAGLCGCYTFEPLLKAIHYTCSSEFS
jgi:hypothetical protein